ncbi:hypothetical protein JXA85_00115 [Candidatus Woesearchaeota archaeon]|nr:hypothetical protein [Candidatus Woesearchaeota archaeon]
MAKDEVDEGESEENVYKEKKREELVDNDEISPGEEGFMEGYDSEEEDEEKEEESEHENEE